MASYHFFNPSIVVGLSKVSFLTQGLAAPQLGHVALVSSYRFPQNSQVIFIYSPLIFLIIYSFKGRFSGHSGTSLVDFMPVPNMEPAPVATVGDDASLTAKTHT